MNNQQFKREIKKIIPFTIPSKRIKYLGINLTKEAKDLYNKNYKAWLKEIKDTNEKKDILCSWILKGNIVKMSILPKVIYKLNAIPIKIPMAFFAKIEKIILKFIGKLKEPWIAKTILRKINKAGGFLLPDFKTHYKATVVKTVWYWHKSRHIHQWNRIESPVSLHINDQMIFNKGAQATQWGRNNLKQTVLGKQDLHKQKDKVESFLYSTHKNLFKIH